VATVVVRLGARLIDVLLVTLAIMSLAGAVVARMLPATGHELVVIAGGSMEPTIPIGSLVVLEPVGVADLRAGDIVSIRAAADRSVVTHRIVRVVERAGDVWLEMRGDANAEPDPVLVPARAVLGRAALIEPGLGRALTMFGTPSGFLVLGGVAGLLYGVSLALRALEERQPRRSRALGAA
jgi:signal peptidase